MSCYDISGLSCTVWAVHLWLIDTFPRHLGDIHSWQFIFSFSVHAGGFLGNWPVSSMPCVACSSVCAAWPISRLSPQCAASKCAFPTMVRGNKLPRHATKTMTALKTQIKNDSDNCKAFFLSSTWLGNKFSSSHARVLVVGVWCYASVFAVGPLAKWGHYSPEPYGTACCIDWLAPNHDILALSYIICLFFFCYALPCAIIFLSYTFILLTVRGSRQAVQQHVSPQTKSTNAHTLIVKVRASVSCSSLCLWPSPCAASRDHGCIIKTANCTFSPQWSLEVLLPKKATRPKKHFSHWPQYKKKCQKPVKLLPGRLRHETQFVINVFIVDFFFLLSLNLIGWCVLMYTCVPEARWEGTRPHMLYGPHNSKLKHFGICAFSIVTTAGLVKLRPVLLLIAESHWTENLSVLLWSSI